VARVLRVEPFRHSSIGAPPGHLAQPLAHRCVWGEDDGARGSIAASAAAHGDRWHNAPSFALAGTPVIMQLKLLALAAALLPYLAG
jgi:hypothetical protein